MHAVPFRWIVAGLVAFVAGCGNRGASDRFPAGDADANAFDDGGDGALDDVEPIHPDGDPNLGGPCTDDAQCAKPDIKCATFACDHSVHRCRATPDDTKCDDGIFCDGAEKCDSRSGCVPGPVIDCSSGDTCMIDRCVEATHGCTHVPRDVDADGDPTNECPSVGGGDCDDHDPTVNSKTQEVCGNGKDDNCNGLVDESPCLTPAHSTCSDALVITTDGTYPVSLAGTSRTASASCASSTEYPRQSILAVKVPAGGGPKDVQITANASGAPIAIAADKLCDDPTTEIGCIAQPTGATSVRLKLRAIDPGTYAVYIFGSAESDVEVSVAFLPPSAPPTNVSCTTAATLLDGTTTSTSVDVSLADLGSTPSACTVGAGPLVYRVSIPASLAPRDLDVRVGASSTGVRGILGLRDAGCLSASDELRCGSGDPAHLFVRALGAGTYYVTVAASAPSDVTIDASLSPPTPVPADASCTGAPTLVDGKTITVHTAGHEDDIPASCVFYGSAPPLTADAAYAFTLADSSDVLIVAHPSGSDVIGLGLTAPSCTVTDYGCARGYPTRLVRRALAAGDYRVVVQSENMSDVSLSTFIRTPAATPGPVGGDACADVVTIPSTGGLFVGSTDGKTPDFSESCDTGGMPPGGAPDVVYRIDLPVKSRLVVDMAGSAYTTILSIRQGSTCPGTEILDACAAGFVVDNAFLDEDVAAGTYWIVVDGYALSSGSYRMDVRVAPPFSP